MFDLERIAGRASLSRPVTRRGLLRRGAALALSLPAISLLLQACGGDDNTTSSTKTSSGASGTNTTTTGGTSAVTVTTAASGGTTPSAGTSASPSTGGTSGSPAAGGMTPTSGSSTATGGGTFTLAWPVTTPDLDPQSAYSYMASSAFRGTYEMLIQLNGSDTFQYVPMLANAWSANADGTEYSFTLNDNIKFHDGTACDATAVMQSLQRFLNQGLGPVNVLSRFVDKPEDITAPDAKTVMFKLKTPNALFLAAMASQYGPMIISPAAVEKNKTTDDEFAHEWAGQNMVGTGPYKQKEYSPNERLVMDKFDDYYRGWNGAHFDEIVIRIVPESSTQRQLMESGEVDSIVQSLTPKDVKSIEDEKKLQVLRYDSTNVYWAIINAGKLKDPKIRQGLSYAFPYDDVRDGVYEGLLTKTGGPVTPTTKGYDPNVFTYETDLDKAKQLLTDASFDFSQQLEYRYSNASQAEASVGQLFQANLQQIGVTVNLVQQEGGAMEGEIYSEKPPEERPHFYGGWGWWPDYNDTYNQMYPNFATKSWSPNGSNGGFYSNTDLDAILDAVAPGVRTTSTRPRCPRHSTSSPSRTRR